MTIKELNTRIAGKLKKLKKYIRRSWSAWSQPMSGGLIKSGDWRAVYHDGKKTYWMTHGDARNCLAVDRISFNTNGGFLEWRGDIES